MTIKTEPEYVRPDDNREIVGSPYKIQSELGWKRERNIRATLHDMIAERLVEKE